MQNIDIKLVADLMLNVASLCIYIYCGSKQWAEAVLPRDWLTRLRWIILGALIMAAVSVVPVIVYQISRIFGVDSDTLRSIAGTGGGLSRFGGALLLLLIFTYKRSE